MTAAEKIFWAEVDASRATSRSLKVCYAILLASHEGWQDGFWSKIHDALRVRLNLDTPRKLDNFKSEAWSIYASICAQGESA